jgi:adenine deaminase
MTSVNQMQRLISVAMGDSPADLLLTGARIANTLNGRVEMGSVAICAGRVAGVGDYRRARETIDLKGQYLAPGLIDGHVHLESSMLDIGQYARAVVPCGTAAIVTDLHEIANVCGLEGIRYVLASARRLPFDLFLMAPSCVPATHLETSGAAIGAGEIKKILRYHNCLGLGEVMNYPGVLSGNSVVLAKIAAAWGKIIDGHAPGLTGKDLEAYVSAGIMSDHECISLPEAEEKLRLGMCIMIREGSSEKNLEALLPLVTAKTYSRCLFVTDDRHARDILGEGAIDGVVRKAIRLGLEPLRAVQLATINAARYFRLEGLGAIAPGYFANIIVLDDLESFQINTVFYRGKMVAREGKALFTVPPSGDRLTDTVNVRPFGVEALRFRASGASQPVIEVIPGQIVTRKRMMKVKIIDGYVMPDTTRDILKAVVVERHRATGNIGLGLVTGFGLKNGAVATSTAHDSHNIVAVGANDEDIFAAIKEIERMQGGVAVVEEGKVLESLATPIAGLLAAAPLEEVVIGLQRLEKAAKSLGTTLPAPFSVLSFLALPVIPELRLTDLGLVDVKEFKLIQ